MASVQNEEDEPCTEYEERAAILEYMAGMPRPTAERKAKEQIEAKKQRQMMLFRMGGGETR